MVVCILFGPPSSLTRTEENEQVLYFYFRKWGDIIRQKKDSSIWFGMSLFRLIWKLGGLDNLFIAGCDESETHLCGERATMLVTNA
jgi:hypothetical protein